jgi:SAM-dependent methyltransferase
MTVTSVLDTAPANFLPGAPPTRHQVRRGDAVVRFARGLSGSALDYGCGWGDLTARLAPQFSSIMGVDADPARVGFARQHYAPIEFATCRSGGVDALDASFDVVLSVVVVHFVPSVVAYLQECHRLVRPGGTLVLVLKNPDSFYRRARRLRGIRTPRPEWGESLSELQTFVERNHWRITRTGGFYDPPFERLHNPGDFALSVADAVGHLLHLPRCWSYVGLRCVRVD